MQNLADVVLDYLWFLHFSEDDSLDPDDALKLAEKLGYQIENDFALEEKQALQDSATRRLQFLLREPDENGYTPRMLVTEEQKLMLQDIAAGDFDIPSL